MRNDQMTGHDRQAVRALNRVKIIHYRWVTIHNGFEPRNIQNLGRGTFFLPFYFHFRLKVVK